MREIIQQDHYEETTGEEALGNELKKESKNIPHFQELKKKTKRGKKEG